MTELLITTSQGKKKIISLVCDLNSCLAEGELPILLSAAVKMGSQDSEYRTL